MNSCTWRCWLHAFFSFHPDANPPSSRLPPPKVSKLGFIKSVHIALAKAPQREELFSAAFRFILRAVSSRSKAAVNSTTSLALVTVETMKNHLGSIEVAALAAKVHLHQLISRDDEVRAAALQCAWQGSIAAAAQVAGALYLTHPSGAVRPLLCGFSFGLALCHQMPLGPARPRALVLTTGPTCSAVLVSRKAL